MQDILKQIQSLKEDFSNVLEGLNKEEKEKRNKEYRTMMGKFRKDAYAEDKDPKYSLDSEHGQKVFDYIKKRLGNLSYDPSSAKREEKLLFRTESLDILKQIQNLKEDFMNLIEVEGLGEPASDVPPSTNKIKRDKKTKDGKVELVSVEDELFPKDGNAREQFRQKILDVINGMIQGTATLEDLMQIVRAKKNGFVKEGFEGALDILEGWAKDKRPEAAKKSLKSREKEHFRALGNALDAADVYGADNCEPEAKEANRAAARVAHARNVIANESLEKGIAILEEIINEVSVGTLAKAVENNLAKRKANAEKSQKAVKDAWQSYNDQSVKYPEEEGALYQAASNLDKQALKDNKKARHAEDLADLNLPKNSKVSANKLFKAAHKAQPGREKESDSAVGTGERKKFKRAFDRDDRAWNIAFADPVKAREENAD